ncbi:MAG: hypothetical protein AB7V16_13370 [Vulcanibacillus sp.]
MKRLLTLFLVIGVLGIYGQTTECEIQTETQAEIDTIQQADTVKINEQQNEDTSVIKENIDSKGVSGKGNDDSLITMKKNPWLYDWRYGCLTDGLTYLIPMITLYSIAERVDDNFLPLDNYCTPCIYPIGLVFAERMWKSSMTIKGGNKVSNREWFFSISLQKGVALPYYSPKFEYQEGNLFPNIGFLDFNLINFENKVKINSKLKIYLSLGLYNFYISGPSFYLVGTGITLNDFNVSIEKVLAGYYTIGDVPSGIIDRFLINNYQIIEKDNHYIVNFKYDFWGVGIGWGKKYTCWKELYVEPKINYKFMYTSDFRSGCITGIVAGLGIGYKF